MKERALRDIWIASWIYFYDSYRNACFSNFHKYNMHKNVSLVRINRPVLKKVNQRDKKIKQTIIQKISMSALTFILETQTETFVDWNEAPI